MAGVHALVDTLGDVSGVVGGRAHPDQIARLYRALNLGVRYQPSEFGG